MTEIVILDTEKDEKGTFVAKAGRLIKNNERVLSTSFAIVAIFSFVFFAAFAINTGFAVHADTTSELSTSLNMTFGLLGVVMDDTVTLVPHIMNFIVGMIPLMILGGIIGVAMLVVGMIGLILMLIIGYMEGGMSMFGGSGRSGGRRSGRGRRA